MLNVIAINSSRRKMNTYGLISGSLKTFLDRTCKCFHRPEIYGKPILVISTTKGSGLKSTLKYLERVVVQWGGFKCNINVFKRLTAKSFGKFLDRMINKGEKT